ncbi:hypothetical protein XCR_4211 [Xanthomonas campestris pv. raphani 756C]|nr:hypothetical protein XCR_4211 [Xanthomonas campestris pv. raphani 756C]
MNPSPSWKNGAKPLSLGAIGHSLRATGARALERPRRKRGPGRAAGVGVRVRRRSSRCSNSEGAWRRVCHCRH